MVHATSPLKGSLSSGKYHTEDMRLLSRPCDRQISFVRKNERLDDI